jgi:hypothetical protein
MTHSRDRLAQLFADIGRITGTAQPPGLSHEGPTLLLAEWGDVAFELRHSGDDDDDALLVRCRLGALPEARAIAAMKRLLEIQAELTRDDRALLSLDPNTGEACVTQALSLQTATADELASTLAAMKDRADEWKVSQFLDMGSDAESAALI